MWIHLLASLVDAGRCFWFLVVARKQIGSGVIYKNILAKFSTCVVGLWNWDNFADGVER